MSVVPVVAPSAWTRSTPGISPSGTAFNLSVSDHCARLGYARINRPVRSRNSSVSESDVIRVNHAV